MAAIQDVENATDSEINRTLTAFGLSLTEDPTTNRLTLLHHYQINGYLNPQDQVYVGSEYFNAIYVVDKPALDRYWDHLNQGILANDRAEKILIPYNEDRVNLLRNILYWVDEPVHHAINSIVKEDKVNFTDLPNELLFEIFVKADIPTTLNLGLVNRGMNNLMNDEHVWYRKLKNYLTDPSTLKPIQDIEDQPNVYQEVYLAMTSLGVTNLNDYLQKVLKIIDRERGSSKLRKNYQLALTLIKIGADVNFRDNKGMTALMFAANMGHSDVVEQLVAAGADVNLQDNNGATALIWAKWGTMLIHSEVVRKLLAAGADVNHQDHYRETTLIRAARLGDSDVVSQLLMAGADVNVQNAHRETALMAAATAGHSDVVSQLLKANADVNLQDTLIGTALMRAVIYNRPKVVEQLIKAGADLNLQNSIGRTALAFAFRDRRLEIANQLLRAGARLE